MIDFKDFIIPSIDLLDGNIVRLQRGDYNQQTIYNISIDELLKRYANFNTLHIVDLNAARGDGLINLNLIQKIRSKFHGTIQLGGGIRKVQIAEQMLDKMKIDKIVLGTIAMTNFPLTNTILEKFGNKVILAIDCKLETNTWIPKINGWQTSSNKNLFEILDIYRKIAKCILATDIAVDGTMNGCNIELYQQIKKQFPEFNLQASGGVGTVKDILNLQNIVNSVIIGKALYEGLIHDIC